ncbi:ABC transporter permease [Paenibacillus arenilitoris]|uniref:ABC transporter permease n=1 Tax=Paenibacillus arenilitoris TaxID=2772299 RepID=A0A927CSA7_9BACL|nr:ABC transporter permease [Paenibacillus arenilitoris]MBD2872272.1 ABC transporter permease [Paenibacillus arenilitoris]
MINLVHNEMMKLLGKRRFLIIGIIIVVLLALFAYAQARQSEAVKERLGEVDWRTELQQQIVDWQNRLSSAGQWREQLEIQIDQYQYYLDHDVNPSEPGAPSFMRGFTENSAELFLPLLVMIVAVDLVSSERSMGTIKLLLTRPVSRSAVLLSKYIALVLSVSIVIFLFALLSYLISALMFGNKGWTAPVLTGFEVRGGELDASGVRLVSQWQYLLQQFGLAWFISLVVGTLSFMLSILMRSSAAGMGTMLACLISGAILSNMVSSWDSAKYLFMVNLGLMDYMSGSPPPIEGMTLGFSLTVLAVWMAAALAASFAVFTRKDIY